MAINRAFIGRTYPTEGVYEVGREKIREFATAIGDLNPAYFDIEAAKALGHPDVIAPPTFLTTLNFRFAGSSPMVDPDFGMNYALVVHGEMRFSFHRPLRAGDRIVAVNHVDDIRDAGKNELVEMRTEVTTDDGEAVATLRSTIVSRGTAAGAGA